MRTENIGKYQRCIMLSHGGNPHHRMGWPPISCTHVLSYLIVINLTYRASYWWNKSLILTEQRQHKRNACRIYHPGCCRRRQNWWKLVPSPQSITMQFLYQWKYLSKIRNYTYRKYVCVHCNLGVTYTKKLVISLYNQILSGTTLRG